MTKFSLTLLLICLQSFSECRKYIEENTSYSYTNYRFGVFENKRKTAKIVKEEVFIRSRMREIEAWIQVKGRPCNQIYIPRSGTIFNYSRVLI